MVVDGRWKRNVGMLECWNNGRGERLKDYPPALSFGGQARLKI
jgi:hypothetical protein